MTTGSGMMVEALKLLVLGMGFVYLLLGIMVLAIKALGWMARETEKPLLNATASATPPLAVLPSPAIVAAISAAIHRHQAQGLPADPSERQA
jgi:oxaloacetate decarboxylase gamma subunit